MAKGQYWFWANRQALKWSANIFHMEPNVLKIQTECTAHHIQRQTLWILDNWSATPKRLADVQNKKNRESRSTTFGSLVKRSWIYIYRYVRMIVIIQIMVFVCMWWDQMTCKPFQEEKYCKCSYVQSVWGCFCLMPL